MPRFGLLLCLFLSAPLAAEWHSDRQTIMGTEINARVWHSQAESGRAALAAVMAEMRRIDRHFSPYKEDSELSRLNRLAPSATAETPLEISEELTRLLVRSLEYGELTRGAFDITFGSVGRYYDFRAGQQPDKQRLEELLPAIDYRLVRLDREQQQVYYAHPKVYVDLGGIAKGYAVDRAIALLRDRGIEHASVGAGGDTRLLGDHRGRPWVLGIKNPRRPERTALRLPMVDEAISTSGDYERYFMTDSGERVHHIINPRTGTSASDLASASVMGPRALDTDALSTSVFVLGRKKGLALIDRMEGFEAIVINREGRVYYSQGLTPPD